MSPALMGSVIVVATLTTILKLNRHREAKTETREKKEKKRKKETRLTQRKKHCKMITIS